MPIDKRILCFLFALILLTSCEFKKNRPQTTETVFRYNETSAVSSLDPAYAQTTSNARVINLIYNRLVQLDEKLTVIPGIAKSWSVSDDGLMYTFCLRNDVYFQDNTLFLNNKGRKVRASDFVNSFQRLCDKEIASPAAALFNCIDYSAKSNYKGFVDVNDTLLRIYLNRPYAPFLALLTLPYCSVIPIEVAKYYGAAFRNHPVGTGPFQLKYWKEGEKLVLKKNPTYYESDKGKSLPYLDAVSVSFIKNQKEAFLEFLNGKFDLFSGIEDSYKEAVINKNGTLNPDYKNKIVMHSQPALITHFIGFVLEDKQNEKEINPLKNKLIRKAIQYAIDKEKLLVFHRNNIGSVANAGLLPPALAVSDTAFVNSSEFNPARAKVLIERAGYSESKPCPRIKLYLTESESDLGEFIQSELSAVGLESVLEVKSNTILTEMIAHADLDFYLQNVKAEYAAPEYFLAPFYSKNNSTKGYNVSYKNAQFDECYEKAMQETNPGKRNELYQSMNQLLFDEALIVPLYYESTVTFLQANIAGFTSNPMNQWDLKRLRKTTNSKD